MYTAQFISSTSIQDVEILLVREEGTTGPGRPVALVHGSQVMWLRDCSPEPGPGWSAEILKAVGEARQARDMRALGYLADRAFQNMPVAQPLRAYPLRQEVRFTVPGGSFSVESDRDVEVIFRFRNDSDDSIDSIDGISRLKELL